MIYWKDSFSCEIADIDNQHKRLFEIAGKIYDLATQREETDKYDEIINVIEELKNYTIEHFKFEEQLMLENSYDGYDIQKIEHDFFIKKLQRIERKDIDNSQNEAVVDMISFITDWISSHILKTDKNYVEFFKTKGMK